MRPSEINSLFAVCGLSDVCQKIAGKEPMLANLQETQEGKAHGRLMQELNGFFERRNQIAHSLNLASSSGPDQILGDIEMFDSFCRSLQETLESPGPSP